MIDVATREVLANSRRSCHSGRSFRQPFLAYAAQPLSMLRYVRGAMPMVLLNAREK